MNGITLQDQLRIGQRLGMINKYLQEADEKQNILFYGKLLPSKTVHVKHTVFDGVTVRCLEISHTVLSK